MASAFPSHLAFFHFSIYLTSQQDKVLLLPCLSLEKKIIIIKLNKSNLPFLCFHILDIWLLHIFGYSNLPHLAVRNLTAWTKTPPLSSRSVYSFANLAFPLRNLKGIPNVISQIQSTSVHLLQNMMSLLGSLSQ